MCDGTQILWGLLRRNVANGADTPPMPCQPNEMPSPTVVTCRQCIVLYAQPPPTVVGAKPSQPEVNPAPYLV